MVNMQISYLKASFPFGWNEKLFDFVGAKCKICQISLPRDRSIPVGLLKKSGGIDSILSIIQLTAWKDETVFK